ncbi:hypothetical protein [Azohydromonas lata]|uniref:hypothetical protein n=1 Tax=Azohydromonas lata TaxID=45677 RepID=UPI00082FB78F|nr:hypothetical protein [Azohydromonas lata]
MKKFFVRSAAVALAASAFTLPCLAVVIDFDLDTGTLLLDTPGTGALDEYRSGTFGIGAHTFSPTNPNTFQPLPLEVRFVDAQTGRLQTVTLATLGLGGGQNAPSTFGSISDPPGGHNFGPSLILSSSLGDFDVFNTARATITPTVVSGTIAADFNATGGSVCGHGADNDCDFGARLPDLLDGPDPLVLSGFRVDFGIGVASTTTFDTFEFRMISPSLIVTTIPETSTWVMLLTGLVTVALGVQRRRRSVLAELGNPPSE